MGNWVERAKESAARRTAAEKRAVEEATARAISSKHTEEERLMSIGRERLTEFEVLKIPEKLTDVNREWRNLGKVVVRTNITPAQAVYSASLVYIQKSLVRETEPIEKRKFGFYTEYYGSPANPEQQSTYYSEEEHKFGFHTETIGYKTVRARIASSERSLSVVFSTDPRTSNVEVDISNDITRFKIPDLPTSRKWRVRKKDLGWMDSGVVISFPADDADLSPLVEIVDGILLQSLPNGLETINRWEKERKAAEKEIDSGT